MQILKKLDVNLTKKINILASKNRLLIKLLAFITNTSDGRIYILYAILLPLFIPQYWLQILKVGAPAYIFQLLIYLVTKNILKRERPNKKEDIVPQINAPDKYSFPSGHCATATLLVLTLQTFNLWFIPLMIPWVIIIYLSRVALGIHYVSDIIGGILLGIISFFTAKYLFILSENLLG